jgi:hypothetical protein
VESEQSVMTMPKGRGSAEFAHVGEVIEDGDGGRMVIRVTAEQTAGGLFEFDWFIHPRRRMDMGPAIQHARFDVSRTVAGK